MESKLNTEKYLERIKADFFEPIDSYEIIDNGWTNVVIEINQQWIFRFARDINNQQIAIEQDFLPKFAPVCPVNIPEIAFGDLRDIAYRKIVGSRFAPEKFLLLSGTQKTKILQLLGEFLTCLHNFQFSHQHLSSAPYGGEDFWNDLWLLVKNDLSTHTRDKAERYFNDAFKKINTISFDKVLIHADLGTNNVLVNFDQGVLSGVIDFGDLSSGDPAADFASFYRNFGRQFTEELLCYYHRPIEDKFWARIDYESKRKLFFVVYFALNYGFENDVPNILQYIEQLF